MSAPPFRKRHRIEQELADYRRIKPRGVVIDGDALAERLHEVLGRDPDQDECAEDPADSAVPNITVARFAVDFGSPDRDGIARGN